VESSPYHLWGYGEEIFIPHHPIVLGFQSFKDRSMAFLNARSPPRFVNLERDGFRTREVFPEGLPRAEYELTAWGLILLSRMEHLV
jgi:hypothetical protein